MLSDERFVELCEAVWGANLWPRPLHVLQGCVLLKRGIVPSVSEAAARVGTTTKRLNEALRSRSSVRNVLAFESEDELSAVAERRELTMAQVILGKAAEYAFERLYRRHMGEDIEFSLADKRSEYSDTDYRLLNGKRRPLYRINIKLFGTPFERSEELVGISSDDCFALATYKIFGGLEKFNSEKLPYLFVIIRAPGMTSANIASKIPDDCVYFISALYASRRFSGAKRVEDSLIDVLVRGEMRKVFSEIEGDLERRDWFVISARRAYKVMTEHLFERVFALRIPGFVHQFKRAEIDMHFSFKRDMMSLEEFFGLIKEKPHYVTSALSSGDI